MTPPVHAIPLARGESKGGTTRHSCLRRGLVLIVSDFLLPPESLYPAIRALLARKHEVVAFQILDPAERDFSLSGDFIVEDMETGEKMELQAEESAPLYRAGMDDRLEKTRRAFASLGVDYHLFDTGQPLEDQLSLFLQKRLARPF